MAILKHFVLVPETHRNAGKCNDVSLFLELKPIDHVAELLVLVGNLALSNVYTWQNFQLHRF